MANPIVALFLALIHASSGIILLIFSSWFIAACAVAGVNFNYMLPAVVIRALALLRIASGYGQMWVGHQHLLDHIAKIRIRLFSRLHNANITQQALSTDALAHHSEAIANVWMAWVNQNASAIVMLFIGLISVTIWLPTWQWSLIVLCALYLLVVITMCWFGIRLSQNIIVNAAKFRRESNDFLNSASIWHLDSSFKPPSAISLWKATQALQKQSENAALLVQAVSFILLLVLLMQTNSSSLESNSSPVIMIGTMLLLSAKDWLSPSLHAQKSLSDYLISKNAFNTLPVEPIRLVSDDMITHADNHNYPAQEVGTASLQLKSFSADIPAAPQITLEAKQPQIVLLKGSSGTGKSTLLQACAGLLPCKGMRMRNNIPLESGLFRPWHYVEQLPTALNASLRDNLLLANADISDEALLAMLQKVGLGDVNSLQQWLGTSGRILSGGELKRLALARALLCDMEVLLIDEPFEGLDESMQACISSLLNRTAQSKIVIIASHIQPKELHVTQCVELDSDTFN